MSQYKSFQSGSTPSASAGGCYYVCGGYEMADGNKNAPGGHGYGPSVGIGMGFQTQASVSYAWKL
jgi:hypothetical protein